MAEGLLILDDDGRLVTKPIQKRTRRSADVQEDETIKESQKESDRSLSTQDKPRNRSSNTSLSYNYYDDDEVIFGDR